MSINSSSDVFHPGVKRLVRRCFGCLCTIALLSCIAASHAADLSIKPKLCITDSPEKTCQLPLEFAWQADAMGNYCLVQVANQSTLQCWQQNDQGQWQGTQQVNDQELFWLTQDGQTRPLAEAAIEVLSTYTEDRRRNRRRKHVWSLM